MVVPYRHVARLEDLDEAELHEHAEVETLGLKALRKAMNPNGFNLGMNIGKVAGAGIEGHIHTHIVPRWQGDTNCMPVIADVRVIPQALAETYQKLKVVFDEFRS
jgi:ATP adenylyltransferase